MKKGEKQVQFNNSSLSSVGLIHVGDELREVNGIPVDDKKPEEIIHILVNTKHFKSNLGEWRKSI